jgi:hypothetical protein
MFEVKIEGVDQLLKKLDAYGKQIDALHEAMPEELVAWQRDDMKRKYPNLTVNSVERETAATTQIWPRSRLPSSQRKHQGPRQHLINRTRPKQAGGKAQPSTRPILRAELLKRLWDRMMALTSEAMKWP